MSPGGLLTDRLDLLLVEESGAEVELTLRTLARQAAGGRFGVARDGEEALEFLLGDAPGRCRVLPRVVLLGLRLPGRGGLEVLRELRHQPRTSLLPVVVVTSLADPALIRQAYRLGANAVVRKPVAYREFAETLSAVAGFWLRLNLPPPEPPGPPG